MATDTVDVQFADSDAFTLALSASGGLATNWASVACELVAPSDPAAMIHSNLNVQQVGAVN